MQSIVRPRRGIKSLLAPGLPAATLVALLPALVSTPAAAAGEDSKGRSAVQAASTASTKITKEQATQAALAALPGDVTDVTIERKRGKMVYVIEIVAKADGAETDVLVDMDSGKILGMDR